jgi:alpha-ribazole phosphatase
MKLLLLRHGETAGNREKRYIGRTDEPLSPLGRAALSPSKEDLSVQSVYVSPLCRAQETARILFPGAVLRIEPGLREMDFGIFEGKNWFELRDDPDYTAWVLSGCEAPCPEGEGRASFCRHSCAAFAGAVSQSLGRGERFAAVVAHGGTLMAVMERFCGVPYFEGGAPCGCGWLLEIPPEAWERGTALSARRVLRTEERT